MKHPRLPFVLATTLVLASCAGVGGGDDDAGGQDGTSADSTLEPR